MKSKCILMTTCLFLTAVFVSQSPAIEYNKLRLVYLSKSAEGGFEFQIKSKKNLTPNSPCKNEFILLSSHQDFGQLAPFLYISKAFNKKIGIEFDETSSDCNVEVTDVVLY